MEKITKTERWNLLPNVLKTRNSRLRLLVCLAAFCIFCPSLALTKTVTDQVVATVGSSAVTLRDVRIHSLLESLLRKKDPATENFFLSTRTRVKHNLEGLVQRMVILNYLQASGMSFSVPSDRQEEVKGSIFEPFRTKDEALGFFRSLGVEEAEIDRWVMERLQTELFINDQLALRVQLSEPEIRAHYEQKRASRYLGESWEQVKNVVRADLFRDRLRTELGKWLEVETDRVGVILLPLRNGN